MPSVADDDLGSASAFGARFDVVVDVAYRDVGKKREQDARALNTRFNLCVQVMPWMARMPVLQE
jgi:hypothetical protein